MGLGPVSMRHTRFGVNLADFDNDGWLDLYEANGDVGLTKPADGDGFAEPNTLYRGSSREGRFRFDEVKPQGGVSPTLIHTSRGSAVGDLDHDGGLDLVVTNRDASPYVLMNRAARGNWVRFRVRVGNRDAHGATVSATVGGRRLNRDVQPAASYLAANEPIVHFGLGQESLAGNVVVRWPGGGEEAFGDYAAGQIHALRQGAGKDAP